MNSVIEAVKDWYGGRTLRPGDEYRILIFVGNKSVHPVFASLGALISYCVKLLIAAVCNFLALQSFRVENDYVVNTPAWIPTQNCNLCVVDRGDYGHKALGLLNVVRQNE